MVRRKNRKGAALLMSMVIVALLSAWVVAVQSFSGSSVQISNNQHKSNSALAAAESGLECAEVSSHNGNGAWKHSGKHCHFYAGEQRLDAILLTCA